MILLPKPASRGSLRVFWLLASAAAGGLVGALAALPGPSAGWSVGAVAAVGIAVPGLVRPMRVAVAYRAWNRVVSAYAVTASRLVTAICFSTVMLAVGRGAGPSQFMDGRVGASMWVPRRTQPATAYGSQDDRAVAGSETVGWSRRFWAWSGRSGNRWAVALLPFLWALQMLDTSKGRGQDDLPADVYTLY